MATEPDEDEKCRLVTEVAVEQAMEKCGTEDAVRNQLRRIIGLGEDMDPDCDMALAGELGEETLQSTRSTRQWVMCKAWEYVNEDEMTLSSAVSKAWAEANARGEELGIEV